MNLTDRQDRLAVSVARDLQKEERLVRSLYYHLTHYRRSTIPTRRWQYIIDRLHDLVLYYNGTGEYTTATRYWRLHQAFIRLR